MLRHLLLLLVLASVHPSFSQNSKSQLEEEFKKYDITENGYLSGSEITACNCKAYDLNGDNIVTQLEFLKGREGKETFFRRAETVSPDQSLKKSSSFSAGDKVEIEEFGKWYPGNILEVKGSQFKIHYDGYSASFDTWVTKDKIRPPSSNNRVPVVNNNATTNSNTKTTAAGGEYYSGFSYGLGQTYYYFQPDGRVIYGCISGGLEYYDVNGGCAKSPADCGTYSNSGSAVTVKWNNGERYTGNIRGRTIENMNATNLVKVYSVPERLSANYSSGFTGGGVTGVQAYQFTDDGKFIIDKVSGYDHNDGRWGAATASNKKGTYKIKGYTITLSFANGATERHTIYALESKKNPDALGWDCSFLDKAN